MRRPSWLHSYFAKQQGVSQVKRLAKMVLARVDTTGDDSLKFFDKDWQSIGGKKMLKVDVTRIPRVPEHILTNKPPFHRPCVAQNHVLGRRSNDEWKTESILYVMGLLDVNMPMLDGR